MHKEFERINNIISALFSTHDAEVFTTESAKARAVGNPCDPNRVELFEILFDALNEQCFEIRINKNNDEESFRLFSFFESYFSNYIEGTKFEVEEAKEIVESGLPVPKRNEDSHDILATFKILSNRQEMESISSTFQEFLEMLSRRHSILLERRPLLNPGAFKTKNNRTGNTQFVDHSLVKGTLSQGFKYYKALNEPFAKALYMMFLISEVHPFNDGNGRIARIMMNAELVKANQSRIIIPTVHRDDYLGGLRKLNRSKDPSTYIKVMKDLQKFSDNLYGADFNDIKNYLKDCNAYEEPDDARLKIIERNIIDLDSPWKFKR